MSLPILYKYTSFENGLRIIENKKLKWSSIEEFNDPFESRFHIQKDLKTTIRAAALSASLKGGFFLTQEILDTIKQRERCGDSQLNILITLSYSINNIIQKHRDNFDKESFYELENLMLRMAGESEIVSTLYSNSINFKALAHRTIASNFGILCLSKAFNHPLMWAHYAEQHNGMMLELDFNKIDKKSYFYKSIKKVQYQKKYPEITYDTLLGLNGRIFSDKREGFYKNINLIKQQEWEYEQEYRSIVKNTHLDENNLYEIPEECIISITLGCKNDQDKQDLIKQKVNSTFNSMKLHLNKTAEHAYKLNRFEI